MNESFINKSILLICPNFFNYDKEIKKCLENQGANVELFDERPKNSFLVKVIIRIGLNFFIKKNINDHYQSLFKSIKHKKYDDILIISPEVIDEPKLNIIKSLQPQARFILYMWDSFNNKKNSSALLDFFDKRVTFDKQDAEKYKMQFLPLFYCNLYSDIKKNEKYTYDLCFIGTAHSDRYEIVKKIEALGKKHNLSTYTYFYLPNSIMYWVRKLFLKSYKYGNIKDFFFQPLSQEEIVNIFKKSKVIIDINHPLQSGLTSRTLESLGSKRKLITTNGNIVDYDFYNKQNIYILDRDFPMLNTEFFSTDLYQLDYAVYSKYSLESWLINLFSNKVK